ncbi:tyrosine-type recombinase/integrase [Iningainema tapete]|uniref:Tyrosine-type recombinase/integrase n=1 Tax=Iningainema tapete BLCC-T55 TaxID=2748662 RepID=A0A8J7C0L0_9CYAN|nr:tyrosine-type recombinase/integrase [Iningainema tapete]MBD2778218.1 tyrosine-type recombinase/integrase [Iningainema tapete BLCC-T55]
MKSHLKLAQQLTPTEILMAKDIWHASELGLKSLVYRKQYTLNFSKIQQEWYKKVAKKFVLFSASSKRFSTIRVYILVLNNFSDFLTKYYSTTDLSTLDRSVIVDYLLFLNEKKFGSGFKHRVLSLLKTFFDIGVINEWFSVPPHLIRPEDFPKLSKSLPRYIPESVMIQLNQHLDALPEPVMRMVLVIQECGLRVGELLQLPVDCLKQDTKGNWYLQFMQQKMSKEHIIPISSELAAVIIEQQKYIQGHLGKNFEYLFCSRSQSSTKKSFYDFRPKPSVMGYRSFMKFLKILAEDFDIKDNSGKRWNFETHQFRHTVGTRMINNGVPQHIIQRYLGHETPAMTAVYAHIYDETLRKEIEKFHSSRVVNIFGEVVELEETVLSSNDDLEWFKKNVQARALEHGYCARPRMLGDCDIPGFDGCYNCPHWRTNKNFLPILKSTLERTNNVIKKAQNCGWELQVNKNTPIKENLELVIKTLEVDND